ncbi:MAG: hypothetical protein LPK20_07450 [Halomonas sp.]|jgi:hypothetical protein|uniref:Uncharacterized protein n=1 Tax=Billgrantia tianxiuensis TaxID=2497861 RepID=A0A6I6SDJ7_9GAMM|nr:MULTISPECIES: hypothetical protein [Halomonas]MCE8035834.1 hypothetical protein [Halomonas sp. MCCC 1A11057]MDX5433389.1 hypothetical protein [Halomonas sp.]MDX5502993.1 hypothetical protein [Halomonas sp.]QHC48688.1 hypothetical protein EKK97_02415 [Halomonas tianxiuensis]
MDRSRHDRKDTQAKDERETLREGARRLTERDTPDEPAGHKGGRDSPAQDDVYRPDANVDDQKHSAKRPGIDTRRETTPVGGAQVARDKSAHKENIDDKAEQARSNRRNG